MSAQRFFCSVQSGMRTSALLISLLSGAALGHADYRLICRVGPKTSPISIAKKYGMTLADFTVNAPFALFTTSSETVADHAHSAMEVDTSITWVEDDENVTSPESEAKGRPAKGGGLPAVGDRHGLQVINKNLLSQINWSRSISEAAGRSVRVAILDTGLSPKQPAIWSKVDMSLNAVELGKPAYDEPHGTDSNGDGVVDGALGHGTMVAGIVDQISPKSRFVIVRVADSDGMATAWTVIKGLAFAVSSKAEVANVSLGSLKPITALSDVLDWCAQNRLLVVAPIGNNSANVVCYPARISPVICVGGVDSSNIKASFSNWNRACRLAAPAVGFASQFWDGQIAVWSGTSFAAPVVTATIAEGLRATAPGSAGSFQRTLPNAGNSLDRLNPQYKGQLGFLVDFTRFITSLSKP